MKSGSQKGSSIVEMLMVLCLVALFGVCLVSLIIGGANAQSRMRKNNTAESEARIAMSFINVKIRQTDCAGKITIRNENGFKALCFTSVDNENAVSWVFFTDGALYECFINAGEIPTVDISNKIAEIKDCEYELDSNRIKTTISYELDGKLEKLSTLASLRSQESAQ